MRGFGSPTDSNAVLHEGQATIKALCPQILVHIALHDGEERLRGIIVRLIAPFQPSRGALHRLLRLFVRVAVFRALIERHDDVRTEIVLDLHRLFGRKHVIAPVYVGGKAHALVGDIVERSERKHLKSAAVGENGLVPIHEFMQSARLRDELVAGTHIEVIGVG